MLETRKRGGKQLPPVRLEILGDTAADGQPVQEGDVIEVHPDVARRLLANRKAIRTDKKVGKAKLTRMLVSRPRVVPRHRVFDLIVEDLPASKANHLKAIGRAVETKLPLGPAPAEAWPGNQPPSDPPQDGKTEGAKG